MKTINLKRLVLACSIMLGILACRSDGSKDPSPLYLSTQPPGARVLIDNVEFFTPCNLPAWVSIDQTVEISKPGFQSYRGPLIELVQSGANSFTLTLAVEQ